MLETLLLLAVSAQVAPLAEPSPQEPAVYRIVPEESVLAVITDKGGLLGSQAHRHLVVASRYEALLEFSADEPLSSRFSMELKTADLVVDDPSLKATWAGRIAELGVTDDLGTVSEEDREKIRREMLGEKQLDAEHHPEIQVQLVGLTSGADGSGREGFPVIAEVAVSINGQTVLKDVPARFEVDGDRVTVEALGEFTFREFGISPYSAFLGTVKVKNEFHMYVYLHAARR